MENANQNVVSLSEFKKAREHIELKDIDLFVKAEQNALREIDQDISSHLTAKRKLKNTENIRTDLAGVNGRLLQIADWLEDEAAIESDKQRLEAIEKLRKVTSQLVARSEVTRKVLVDDMAHSRYYEQRWLLDPARIIGLLFVGPVGIDTFIEKFVDVPHPDKLGHQVGEAAAAVGLYLAFKKHADSLAGFVYKQVKASPKKVRTLAIASALEMSVRTKPLNDIEPHYPKGRLGGERVIIALKR